MSWEGEEQAPGSTPQLVFLGLPTMVGEQLLHSTTGWNCELLAALSRQPYPKGPSREALHAAQDIWLC